MSSKFFVLDTNVLLHNSDAITCFADNTVVLPMTVIEELDRVHPTLVASMAPRAIDDEGL